MKCWLFFISSLIVLASCNKAVEPQNSTDNPDFYLKGYKNGQPISINAGDENYYMYTSTSKDNEDINYYTGRLAKNDCNTCGEEFLFRFKGDKTSGAKLLKNKEIDVEVEDPKVKYGVQFNTDKTYTSDARSVDFIWNLGDGSTSLEPEPYHLFNADKDYYEVELLVETSKGVPSSLSSKVYTSTECKTWFDLIKTSHGMRLVARHSGGRPSQYLWEFEDGYSASVAELDYDFDEVYGQELIRLTITDENGCVSQSSQNLVVNENYAFTAANFEYDIEEVLPKNGFDQLNTLSLEYTDEFGEVYFSDNQNEDQSIKILNVESYGSKNEFGQTVMRFQFNLNCTLTSLKGNTISFTDLQGYVGVAIPEEN